MKRGLVDGVADPLVGQGVIKNRGEFDGVSVAELVEDG
jgi:hypothetical protein